VCTACTAERPASEHPEVIEEYRNAMLRAAGWLETEENMIDGCNGSPSYR